MSKIICPKCGSERIAENRWGKHIFTEKLFNEVESGQVRILSGKKKKGSHKYWCYSCQKAFGRNRPQFPAEAISCLSLSVHHSSKVRTVIEIYPVDKVVMAMIDRQHQDHALQNRPAIWINSKLWHTFTKKLIKKYLLLEWSKRFAGSEIDEIQWEIKVNFSLAHQIHWKGGAIYPPYWDMLLKQLVKLLRKSLEAADIDRITQIWLEQGIHSLVREKIQDNPLESTAETIAL